MVKSVDAVSWYLHSYPECSRFISYFSSQSGSFTLVGLKTSISFFSFCLFLSVSSVIVHWQTLRYQDRCLIGFFLCLVSTSLEKSSWLTVAAFSLLALWSRSFTLIESISRSVQWLLSLVQWWISFSKSQSYLISRLVTGVVSLTQKKKSLPDTSQFTLLRASTHPTHWCVLPRLPWLAASSLC